MTYSLIARVPELLSKCLLRLLVLTVLVATSVSLGKPGALSDTAQPGPVPMISDVLSCGVFNSAGGLANGTEMQRHAIDLSVFPDAICNDGTGAVFYFRPAQTLPDRNKWVVQLQGGGGCSDGVRCAERWCSRGTAFSATGMSSDETPEVAINANGLMDDRPENPLRDWNLVFIKYCSSDGWRAASRDVVLQADLQGQLVEYRIHFMGNRIIDAALNTLRRDGVPGIVYTIGDAPRPMPDLDEASDFILAGASAGGGGVIQNIDRLSTYLSSTNNNCDGSGCDLRYLGIIDSAFSPDFEPLDLGPSIFCTDQNICDWESLVDYGTQAYSPILEESCLAWHTTNAPGSEWQCADGAHVIRHHVTTPVFIQMGQEDALVSSNFIESGYEVPGVGPFDLDLFRETVRTELLALANIQATAHEGSSIPTVPGIFSTRCPEHETLRDNQHIYDSYIGVGNNKLHFFDVFANWMSGSGLTRVITPENGVDLCGGYAAADCDFN